MGHRLESQEDLLSYFERVNGSGLRTKDDLERYLDCAREVRPLWVHVNRRPRDWALAKQVLLVVLFAVAAAQYIFLDTAVTIASLPSTVYFVGPGKS